MTSLKKRNHLSGKYKSDNIKACIQGRKRKPRYFRPEQIKDRTLELPSTCNGIFFSEKNMSSSRLYLVPGSLINQTLSRPMGNQGPQ